MKTPHELDQEIDVSMREWTAKCTRWYAAHQRATYLRDATDAQLRLQFGELTAQEIRTLRAALNLIVGP
jgi:hypothetical protein